MISWICMCLGMLDSAESGIVLAVKHARLKTEAKGWLTSQPMTVH